MKRRLKAILAIDAVGYSRLMGLDETGTLACLKAHRAELIDPKTAQYNGRTIKLMGDGALLEFDSVIDSVRFAVEMQCKMIARNSDIPANRRIEFRIGVNAGDVIVEDGDIHGDDVNLAARLEALAPAGGICVHGTVHSQVQDKLALDFENLGEVKVKNFQRSVPAFNVLLNEKAKALESPMISRPRSLRRPARFAAAGGVMLLLLAGLFAFWSFGTPDFEPVVPANMEQPLPQKPSIAVLAFDDVSQGEDKGYLSDAISEEVIARLSRFPDFFVIAGNSSFFYKGKPADVRDVAEELGVRYVLEGSQQKAGERLRVTARLVDAVAGNTIWTETYDREFQDIFALQDEVTRRIAAALEQNINLAEYDRLLRQPTENLEAYELVNRGRAERLKFTPEGNQNAKNFSEMALELDPAYSEAHFSLAWVHINCFRWGWCGGRPREEALDHALASARKAVELDPFSSLAHWVLANAKMQADDLEQAVVEYSRAIELNPNSAGVLADSVEVLVYLGRVDEAIDRIHTAIRLNPHHPDWYLWTLAWAQYFFGDYEAGLVAIQRMSKMPNLARRTLAALLVRLDRTEEATEVISEFLRQAPDYTIGMQKQSLEGKFRDPTVSEQFLQDLRTAGLPE